MSTLKNFEKLYDYPQILETIMGAALAPILLVLSVLYLKSH